MTKHKFHGAPQRFQVVADFVFTTYGRKIKHIADVAGGQGMLAKILTHKYNYAAQVVDPRGWRLKGAQGFTKEFDSSFALYFDLIIGLHPDQATRAVAQSALLKPTILIPCCNFWDRSRKLGRNALIKEIGSFYRENSVKYKLVTFNYNSPKNIGLISTPSKYEY